MARASMNPDKARQGGGIEPGIYEVTKAFFKNTKSDFKPNPVLSLVFEAAVCDPSGEKVRGADPVEIMFGFGEKSLEAFQPAQGSGPEDMDPKAMGTDVDAEGNTISCNGSEQFSKSCAAIVFGESLAKLGYPKDVLDRSYAPDFNGLKVDIGVLPPVEINKKYGLRLNTRPSADGGQPTYKVAMAWLNKNYLTSSNGTGSSTAKADKPASKAAAAGYKDKTDDELAMTCLKEIASTRIGPKGAIKTFAQLVGLVTNQFTAKLKMPQDRLRTVQALIKDEAWAKAAVLRLGATVQAADPQIMFTEAGAPVEDQYDDDGNLIT